MGFVFMFTNAICRPSLMAALAEVPAEVRGTVMGMNSTAASAGWLAAAAVGGWILSTVGFAGFGPFSAILALLGAGLAILGRR
jgi:predicted MFS family arabinose efflux permease